MLTADIYNEALRADDAWSAEGRRIFGKRWGDVRYTREGAGVEGSLLRELHDRFRAANAALHNALERV